MRGVIGTSMLVVLAGCTVDSTGEPQESTAAQKSALSSYRPLGFARVTPTGWVPTRFNSTGGGVTVSHPTPGFYVVSFAGLGVTPGAPATGGNVQVATEGQSNAFCRSIRWSGSPGLDAIVQCSTPDGALADSAFAVLYFRDQMPAPSTLPTWGAYAWVTDIGIAPPAYNFNSSGRSNTITKTGIGSYTVHIPGALAIDASMMVTTYGGAAGNVCSVASWVAGATDVKCRDRLGNLVDNAFSFSFATSGPTLSQQGAHAWFDGTSANPFYSSGTGRIAGCSPVSVTGSRLGSLGSIVVSGDLGSWDASPFLRASFVSKYGSAGYCKVESQSNSGLAPASTSTTNVRCYSPGGAVLATPLFTFTQVTSEAAGPC